MALSSRVQLESLDKEFTEDVKKITTAEINPREMAWKRKKNEQKYNQNLRERERGKGIDIASEGDRARDELKFQNSRDFFVRSFLPGRNSFLQLSLSHTLTLFPLEVIFQAGIIWWNRVRESYGV